jgi:7-carboxy-7-deazaguanine synthase
MEKIKISEMFYSAQGEGRFVGVPSIFLRTFGCNFKCAGFGMPKGELSTEADVVAEQQVSFNKWKTFEELPLVNTGCDSYASWHPAFKELSPYYTLDECIDKMLDYTPNKRWTQDNGNDVHLVITGGEPLLGWQQLYTPLLKNPRMQDLWNVTFETNGTQHLYKELKTFIAWNWNEYTGREVTFSVSPKLSASGEDWADTIKPEVILDYQEVGFVYLKFVVSTLEHLEEVDRAVGVYRRAGFKGPVYVMPVGGVVSVYDNNRIHIADEALKRGYYYSPRLHVDLWGNGWGK